jgi:zinc protease
MKTLKQLTIAAATLAALSGYSQVTDYHQIQTPPLRSFTVAQPKRIVLGNGLVIFLQEDHELPLIRGSAQIHGGGRDVPASKAGLLNILTSSWRTGGTQSKTGDELDDFLESRAARVETGGDVDSTSVSMNVLKGDFDAVFPIFVELLQKPAFRQEKIDLAKTQARAGISRRNDEPLGITGREAAKLGYGADSPYARQSEYATIASISRDDLVAFHDRFVQPNNIIVGFVGDFDSAAMEKKLRAAFGSWAKGPQATKPATAGTPAKPGYYLVTKDDVTQANIAVVHPGGPLRSDPDYYATVVMNEILSGGFSGRLMNNIRSKAGLAYGVGGGLGAGWDHPLLFNVSMGTKSGTTVEAINLLKQEVSDLRTKPFTDEELKHAKDTILNAYVFTMDSKAKVLIQRGGLEFYGYPADFWQKYQKGIESVTAADVARVANKWVHPDQLAVLVVGNPKDFDKPLASLGSVTPIDITIPEAGGQPKAPAAAGAAGTPAAAAPAGPAKSTPEGVALAKKVQQFVGGKANIDKVQTTRQVADLTTKTPQGDMQLEMEMTTRYPDAQRRVMKTPMGDITIVVSPNAAFQAGPMGSRDLPASQRDTMLKGLKMDMLTVLRNIEQPGYTFAASGTEKVGDVNAQIVDITGPDGGVVKWTVDPASGRVLRMQRSGASGTEQTEYSDWKPFGGLTLPTTFVISVNGDKNASGTVKSIEVNPAVDPSAFEKPKP